MVKRTDKENKEAKLSEQELMLLAEKVFSAGMLESLKRKGHDFLEAGGSCSFLFDTLGNTYIDADTSGGMYNLGRHNPSLVEEIQNSAGTIDQGNFVMISEEKAKLASGLSKFAPGKLDCALFSVVRGEPVDAACKLARGFTRKSRLLPVEGSFFGDTGFALSLSENARKHNFGTLIPDISFLPFDDASFARRAIDKNTAAVILELVQPEKGCRKADREYVKKLRKLCDKNDALLIIDESSTGFGRTGTKFAFEQYGVEPDILIFGESVCGGLFPMTGMLFTKKLKSFFDNNPLIHLATFGGHDIACRVAQKALSEYESIRAWEGARLRGAVLIDKLRNLKRKYSDSLLHVEGMGLLCSLRLVSPDAAEDFCRKAKKAGMIIRQGKIAKDTLVLRPSLLISDNEMNRMLQIIEKILKDSGN